MQQSHPMLEKEILESAVEAETVSTSFRQHFVHLNAMLHGSFTLAQVSVSMCPTPISILNTRIL